MGKRLERKGELVSKLQALLHAGKLRIAASLPDGIPGRTPYAPHKAY
jgi:hypothetical protein